MSPLFGHRVRSLRWLGRAGLLVSALFFAPRALGTEVMAVQGGDKVVLLDGSGPSLTELGQEVAKLGIDVATVVVVSAPEITGVAAPSDKQVLEALRVEIRKAVAALVPRAKLQEPRALTQAEARTLARSRDLGLTFIEPKLRAGQLDLTVTVRSWSPSFWLRALAPAGVILHHVRFSIRADDQVRRVFPVGKKLLARQKRDKMPVQAPLALACGDLGQGKQEILIVGRQEIVVGSFEGEEFTLRTRASYGKLSVVAAAPLRAPLAAATITTKGALVGSSDREDLLLLDGQLEVRGRGRRAFPLGSDRCTDFTDTGLSAQVTACPPLSLKSESKKTPLRSGESLDLLSIGRFSQISGATTDFTVKLATGKTSAELVLFSAVSGEKTVLLEDVGTQAALSDIDGDGQLDLVTSRAEGEGLSDELSILTSLEGEPVPLARHEMPAIHALGLCPFSGKNPLSLVVASGDDLLLFE